MFIIIIIPLYIHTLSDQSIASSWFSALTQILPSLQPSLPPSPIPPWLPFFLPSFPSLVISLKFGERQPCVVLKDSGFQVKQLRGHILFLLLIACTPLVPCNSWGLFPELIITSTSSGCCEDTTRWRVWKHITWFPAHNQSSMIDS